MTKQIVHFVRFRADEYWSAVKIWGHPHYIHPVWDKAALSEIHPTDIVIFARGTDADKLMEYRK